MRTEEMDKLAEIQDEIRSLREDINRIDELLQEIGQQLGVGKVSPANIIELKKMATFTAKKLLDKKIQITNGSKAKRRR